MAIELDPVDVPARRLAATNRNRTLSIDSPFGGMPTITFQREVLHLDGDQVAKRQIEPLEDVTAEEFVAIVPEYKALLATIPAALDLLAERLPEYRAKQKANG